MRKYLPIWLKLLLSGSLTLGAVGGGCVADALREVADDLNDAANDIDGNDDNDLEEFMNDLEDLFD